MAAKKVTVQVGFVSIKTRFEVAVDKESSGAHAVCTGTTDEPHDPSRVKQTTACPVCDITHSSHYGFEQRGVERDGKMVVLTAEELAGAKGTPITGNVEKGSPPVALAFHPREKVYGSALPAEGVHYMTPDKGGEKAFVLLREAIKSRPESVATIRWAPSSVNALWVLEVVGEVITVRKLCFPEQVRVAPAVAPVEVSDAEVELFGQLIDTSVTDFDLLEYSDTAKQGVEQLIAERAGDATSIPVATTPAPNTGGDLLAAIQASLDATGKKPAPKAAPKKKTAPVKKAAAKKAAPKKRAAKSAA